MTTLAEFLASLDAEIGGLHDDLKRHWVKNYGPVWQEHVPAIVAAVLAEHATDERQVPFVHDSDVEAV